MSKGKDLINSIKYGLYRMLTKRKHSKESKIEGKYKVNIQSCKKLTLYSAKY